MIYLLYTLLFAMLHHGKSDEFCETGSVDDAFFPPFEYEVIVIIRHPKYYLFDMVSGEITKDGLVRSVWPAIDRSPAAVFRWAEPKHKMLENWFKDSKNNHSADSEGYIVFYMSNATDSPFHELIIYKVTKGADILSVTDNSNEYEVPMIQKVTQHQITSATQGISQQSTVWFFDKGNLIACETSIYDQGQGIKMNFTCPPTSAYGNSFITELYPSLKSLEVMQAFALHTINTTESPVVSNKSVPHFASVFIVDNHGKIIFGYRQNAEKTLQEIEISSLKFCRIVWEIMWVIVGLIVVCSVSILVLSGILLYLWFREHFMMSNSLRSK